MATYIILVLGASGGVHAECLELWIAASHRDDCEICLQKINVERVPKFGTLKSIAIFFYSNRAVKILVAIMVVALVVYTMSITHVDRLSSKPHSSTDKLFLFFANVSIFGSVFVISYSPLICLYIWDQWKEWRKSQYHLQIRTSVIEI